MLPKRFFPSSQRQLCHQTFGLARKAWLSFWGRNRVSQTSLIAVCLLLIPVQPLEHALSARHSMHHVSSHLPLTANIWGWYHHHLVFHRLRGLNDSFQVMRPATSEVRIDSTFWVSKFPFWITTYTITNLGNILKSRAITLPTNVRLVKAVAFPVVMYGCESWTIKKAEHQRTDAFELCCWRRLLNPLDCKEIQPVNPKGNQPWIFIGRADAEAPILWPPDGKSWLTGKDPDAGKGWWREETGATEDEMVGWHHRLNGREFEQTLGDGEGQGNLVCCSPWGHKSQTRLSNWATTVLKR